MIPSFLFLKKGKLLIQLSLFVIFPVILLVLPAEYFDQGTSISVFSFFGVEDLVYSTGMTRAIMHLIHLDFKGAVTFNTLSFVVLPLIVWVYLKYFFRLFRKVLVNWPN